MDRKSNPKAFVIRCRVRLRRIPWPLFAVSWAIALGIGANTGVFTVGALVFAHLPYPHPEQLVVLRPEIQDRGWEGISSEDFIALRLQTTAFQDLNASTPRTFRLNSHAGSHDITASLVTPGFFQMMGDRFSLGYDFDRAEGTLARDRLAILSHAMWEELGADKFVIGSTINMDTTPYTVVGVLAPGLRDRGAPVTVPLVLSTEPRIANHPRMNVIGRLRPGISVLQAQANTDMALARISRSDLNLEVVPINTASFNNDRKLTIWLLLGVVMFILLTHSVSVLSLFRLRLDATLKRDLDLPGGF
jgi:putative ABC transport system permease protein